MMLDIEDVVRKQIALYRAHDIRAERAQRAGRSAAEQLSFGPYLLISREKGAGGSAVGRLAGQRMGWQVFDAELVDAIAQHANVRRELIESLDERAREIIEEIVRGFLAPQSIDTPGYLASLREVVLTLGHQGNVVLVGRGAQYILPSQFGLRVRLVAPSELRIRRIASEGGMDLKAARVAIENSDRERARVIRRYYDRDVHDPLNYDLLLNTAELTVEAAAEITVAAARRKLSPVLKKPVT
jgi:hypothetical protein